jgi:hypothetical protein
MTFVKLVQLKKASDPMLVTLLGIVMDVIFEQLEKAPSLIPVTPFEIMTFVRLEQNTNEYFPMLATLLGMMMLVGLHP